MNRKTTLNGLFCCPHCLNDYDPIDATPCYRHQFNNFEDILFVALCRSCRREFNAKQHYVHKRAVHRIGKNICSNPERRLSVTSEVAMVMNDYNFCDALENGHGLTREAYNAVKQGNYCKLAYDQSGLIMMCTTK